MTWFKDLMSIGKDVFSKENIDAKRNKEDIQKKEESETKAQAEDDQSEDLGSLNIDTLDDLPQVEEITEDLINVNIKNIFPRLKTGHLDKDYSMSATAIIEGKVEEIKLPKHSLLEGLDLGPDFTCCFALDLGDSYQLLTKEHFKNSIHTPEELYKISLQNFLNVYGKKLQLHNTKFEGVRMVRTDGNTEANTFLLNSVWQKVCDKLNSKSIYVTVPLQDIVLCWEDIPETTLKDVIENVEQLIESEPDTRKVSKYLFEFKEGSFRKVEQIFTW